MAWRGWARVGLLVPFVACTSADLSEPDASDTQIADAGERRHDAANPPASPDATTPSARVEDLSLGETHSCALYSSGRIRCWGSNRSGQLGLGHTDDIGDDEPPSDAPFVDLGGKAVQVSAGGTHTCALLDTGNVRCWGGNSAGQLGYGHTDNIGEEDSPASAGDIALGGAASAVDAGLTSTCALLETGDVRCWGANNVAQLGLGHTDNVGDDESPADVPAIRLGGSATRIGAGGGVNCAKLESGDLRCWGSGGFIGQGNDETVGDDEHPDEVDPVQLGDRLVSFSVSGHTCASLAGGVRCWGNNFGGQLGYGHTDRIGDDEVPADTDFVDVGGSIKELSVYTSLTCALFADSTARCWGHNGFGQLGLGHTDHIGDDELPSEAPILELGGEVRQIRAGGWHACALLASGDVRCWGLGSSGQLGQGSTENIGETEVPADVPPVPLD